jgi:beta-lactam-binding protein with PASTA domain
MNMTIQERIASAEAALKELGLTALFSGSGERVTAQLPGPETVLEAGSQVLVYLGETAPQAVTVPDLTGMTPAKANEAAASKEKSFEIFMKKPPGKIRPQTF